MECHESIRAAEKTQEEEIKWRQEKEQQILGDKFLDTKI